MHAMQLRIASYQGFALYDELEKSVKVISEVVQWSEAHKVDILCFPECFLQGYILNEQKAGDVSIDLATAEITPILKALHTKETTVILGLIEREKEKIYNTAIVVEKGKIIGKYRKHFIHNKETIFTCGTDFPVFTKKDIKYGINICYDSRFPESAEALVKQGAKVIFCPLNNSLPHAKADEWKNKHIEYLIDKAKKSSCWIVSADVVEKSQTNTGYGCTCLVSPEGVVVEYLGHSKVGKLMSKIDVS